DEQTGISTWTSPAGSAYQRRSAWRPPTAIPDDVLIPAPRLVEPLDLPPDRHIHLRPDGSTAADDDLPLWTDPTPPAPPQPPTPRRRTGSAEDGDQPPWQRPEAGQPASEPEHGGGWDDPPPF
ncbi:MAG: hypothetical protein M3P04_06490, partial [Actinomycetota bacterium]|nr:hypothetical protein [Actinomycetota bacterium]